MSGTGPDEGASISVLLAPEAKHYIISKFCSVPFFYYHLYLEVQHGCSKQMFQLVFVLSQNRTEENLIVLPNIQLLKICPVCLSVSRVV